METFNTFEAMVSILNVSQKRKTIERNEWSIGIEPSIEAAQQGDCRLPDTFIMIISLR